MGDNMIGVIGGSGLYDIADLENKEELILSSGFGSPSDLAIKGTLKGLDFVFLPRHGRHHTLNPSEINYRANIDSLKKIGVKKIISISAVGSLKEKHNPGKFLIIDQFIDKTYKRQNTFFENGCVAHFPFAEPVCGSLAKTIGVTLDKLNMKHEKKGTYICIEGPQFSTKAESLLYRSWDCDVIGMTNLPEAKLAREAGICYSSISMVTDYDCWHNNHESVTVSSIKKTMEENKNNVLSLIRNLPESLKESNKCKTCNENASNAVITTQSEINQVSKEKLKNILKK
jgi:5'-methylthioadenosine phosphorylase